MRHDSMKKVPTFPGVDKDMATMGRGRSQYALQIPVYSNLVSGETWVNRTTLSQLPHGRLLSSSPPSLIVSCLCTERDQDCGTQARLE